MRDFDFGYTDRPEQTRTGASFMSESQMELRGTVAAVAERFSSYESVDDLMQEDPLDIEYTVNQFGDVVGVELTITTGGPGIYVELPKGVVKGYWAGDSASASIGNPRGQNWMFEFYAQNAPMNL
jgi:hypothetical protein